MVCSRSPLAAERASDELTPLLPAAPAEQRRPTPLPKLQICLLLFMQFAEPVCSQCIHPFLNQLIDDFEINSGDPKKTGYYAGVIFSVFFLAEASSAFHWSSLSDTIGRKPVLMIGLLGACLSMLLFGFSRTLLGLILSRAVCGILNGNNGVLKSMLGEITDESNRAQGFAMIPVSWYMGSTVGALMGGTLERPREHFPEYFSGEFWKRYPYLLPCMASAAFVVVVVIFSLAFLKETAPAKRRAIVSRHSKAPCADIEPAASRDINPPKASFRDLMVFPVIISIANYANIAFIMLSFTSLYPLFCATPPEFGGLGLDPLAIGQLLSICGLANCTFQALFFAKIVNWLGAKRVFVTSILCALPMFALFPAVSFLARYYGWTTIVWAALGIQLIFKCFFDMSFGCIFIFITTAAPNPYCLGATNGLSQTTVSIARAVGPVAATSLFAFSTEHNLLGGNAVYVVLCMLSCFGLILAAQLPSNGWTRVRVVDVIDEN